MERILIVDGHSAIFSTPELLNLHRSSGNRARIELVRQLTNFQDFSDYVVVIVFDGKGATRDVELRQKQDILVMYSKAGETADTVIERIAAQQASKNDVTVASNDRLVLDTISAFGAIPMSIAALWDVIDRI